MSRNIKGRYNEQPESKIPESKAVTNQAYKRRALGDITNASNNDENKDNNKKTTMLSGLSIFNGPSQTISNAMADNTRPYMQRPSDDIDDKDSGNPLLVSSYVNDMYDHFRDLERKYAVNPNYMSNQPYVNEKMRCILIDWLVDVHLKFKMVPESLYLTISIIDRYLQVKQVRRARLQLVGVGAILVAAKYEEIYAPDFKDLVNVTDRAYTQKDILEIETEIVMTLNYDLTIPTIHSFLCRYLKAGHADRPMVQLACYLAERSLQELRMTKYLPSVVAATAVLVARKSLRRYAWSPTLLQYTGLDERDLQDCINELGACVNNPSSQQQAVLRKYSSAKFGSVARMQLMF
eukprot:gene17225-22750_t